MFWQCKKTNETVTIKLKNSKRKKNKIKNPVTIINYQDGQSCTREHVQTLQVSNHDRTNPTACTITIKSEYKHIRRK